MIGAGAVKPLRHPRLWLGLWWLALLLVVVACLVPLRDLPALPPGGDKIEHFLAWFLLAAGAVQLFRGRRALWRAAIGLVLLGVAVEVAQGAFTSTRSMDPMDALADAIGVLLGSATALTPLRDLLLRIDRRRD